jgi:hypothetical protein
MTDDSRFTDIIKGDPSSRKNRQLRDRAKTTADTRSRNWTWPDDHRQYDWMDHFSPPDISGW